MLTLYHKQHEEALPMAEQTEAVAGVLVDKNKSEVVRVVRTEFNGHQLIDARVAIRPITPRGEMKLTKKGLSLRDECWRELLPHIQALLNPADDNPPGEA
jgi:hypothetical protein